MMISNVFLMLSRSMTSAGRIFEVMDEPPAIADGTNDITVQKGSIDFDHVSFKYKESAKEYVLSDVSLHIGAGQMVGIIGGTGSAKSSLVQLIPRLYDVSSGVLKIDGHDVKEYHLDHLRDAVGMVLQKNTLFSGTIRENLKWGNENATDEELNWACHIACADEFLQRMPEGYETDLGQGGVNVSGGQKQRLCIARALLKRPKVLIFDDSTSAVDTATEMKIRTRLQEELYDVTKIVITQRISSIEKADLIVVLDNGRINEIGTHEQLLKDNPIYQTIYEFQRKGAA
jgi:ATP-binding cassette subfamily B protein